MYILNMYIAQLSFVAVLPYHLFVEYQLTAFQLDKAICH